MYNGSRIIRSSTTITGTPDLRLADKSIKGRNGCLWSSNPIGRQSVRRSVRNLVKAEPGPIVPVNFSALLEEYFKLLVSEEILEIAVHHIKDVLLSVSVTLARQVKLTH